MEKTIDIGGKSVRLRATAAVPRLYRIKFGKDILQDISRLEKALKKAEQEENAFSVADLETFENCAYIMAKHADPENVPGSIDEWLDQFDTFSIYLVLPEIIELWRLNEATAVESKKKLDQLTAR